MEQKRTKTPGSGRTKGTPNKSTQEARELLQKVLGKELDKLGLETVTTPEPPQVQNEETEDSKDGDLWDKLALIHYLNKYKLLKCVHNGNQ